MRRRVLSDFNSPPPREVPLSVSLRVLFGGFNNQFGWIFFGFGLIFVWVFALHADISSWIVFRLNIRTTMGVIQEIQATNASENDVQIFEVRYQYFDNLGKQQSGLSYTTGNPRLGGQVNVEYLSSIPSISRVVGMRREVFGPAAIFVIIFPLIGLGFLYSGISYGLKANRLLSHGRIAFGELISTESTGTRINNRPVLKLTFSFPASAGLDWEVTAKTHEPEDLQDEAREPVLYDPDDPSIAVLLDNLPGPIEFDVNGNLLSSSSLDTVKTLILPGLSLVGHGIYLVLAIFGPL